MTLTPQLFALDPSAAANQDGMQWTLAVPLSGGRTLAFWANLPSTSGYFGVASICTDTTIGTPVTVVSLPTGGVGSNGPTAALVGTDLVLIALPTYQGPGYGAGSTPTELRLLDCSGSTPTVVASASRTDDIDGRLCYSTTPGQAIYGWYQDATIGGLAARQTYLCVLTIAGGTISFGAATAWPESADSAASGGWNGTVGIYRAANYAYFFSVSAGAVVVGPQIGSGLSSGYHATVPFGGHDYDLANAYGPWCYWPSPTQSNVWYAIANWDPNPPWVVSILKFIGDGTTVTPTAAYQVSGAGAYNSSDPHVPYNDASPVALAEVGGLVNLVVAHQSAGPAGDSSLEYHTDIFGTPIVQELVLPSYLHAGNQYSLWAGNCDGSSFPFVLSSYSWADSFYDPFLVVIADAPNLSGVPGGNKVHFISAPTGMGPFTMGA